MSPYTAVTTKSPPNEDVEMINVEELTEAEVDLLLKAEVKEDRNPSLHPPCEESSPIGETPAAAAIVPQPGGAKSDLPLSKLSPPTPLPDTEKTGVTENRPANESPMTTKTATKMIQGQEFTVVQSKNYLKKMRKQLEEQIAKQKEFNFPHGTMEAFLNMNLDGLDRHYFGGTEDKVYVLSLSKERRRIELDYRSGCRKSLWAGYIRDVEASSQMGHGSTNPTQQEISASLERRWVAPYEKLRENERMCADKKRFKGFLLKMDYAENIAYISYSPKPGRPDKIIQIRADNVETHRKITCSTPRPVSFYKAGHVLQHIRLINPDSPGPPGRPVVGEFKNPSQPHTATQLQLKTAWGLPLPESNAKHNNHGPRNQYQNSPHQHQRNSRQAPNRSQYY